MEKKDAKQIVLPHSKAKLDLYQSYLEKYFAILGLAKGVNRINLYDIFCGIGQYEDGNIGSPLIAVNCVIENNSLFDQRGWTKKPISLSINDGSKEKIENVKALLKGYDIPNCSIRFFNLDANVMLDMVISEIASMSKTERNLIFIDPYGYSDISKEKILGLLKTGRSEILLFLPVMQMYRFTGIAQTDFERKCYEDLRNFISDFLPQNIKFNSVFEYIGALTKSFSFANSFYSCSHYIERDPGNFYAVFFITSPIDGLERMLEVKWKADPSGGKGFKKVKDSAPTLFGEQLLDYDKQNQIEYLKERLLMSLERTVLSNVDLYELAISNGFLPKHLNEVIRILRQSQKIINCDEKGNPVTAISATYIDYDHYKRSDRKIHFKLRR